MLVLYRTKHNSLFLVDVLSKTDRSAGDFVFCHHKYESAVHVNKLPLRRSTVPLKPDKWPVRGMSKPICAVFDAFARNYYRYGA